MDTQTGRVKWAHSTINSRTKMRLKLQVKNRWRARSGGYRGRWASQFPVRCSRRRPRGGSRLPEAREPDNPRRQSWMAS